MEVNLADLVLAMWEFQLKGSDSTDIMFGCTVFDNHGAVRMSLMAGVSCIGICNKQSFHQRS